MTDLEADILEKEVPEIIIIDSRAKGVKYIFDSRKDRFAIAGKKGKVMLTIKQARTVLDELSGILELRDSISERIKPWLIEKNF